MLIHCDLCQNWGLELLAVTVFCTAQVEKLTVVQLRERQWKSAWGCLVPNVFLPLKIKIYFCRCSVKPGYAICVIYLLHKAITMRAAPCEGFLLPACGSCRYSLEQVSRLPSWSLRSTSGRQQHLSSSDEQNSPSLQLQ